MSAGKIQQRALAGLGLSLNEDALKSELDAAEQAQQSPRVDNLEEKATDYAARLSAINATDIDRQQEARAAVEGVGRDLQRESARRSAILKAPIADFARQSEDGGPVAQALIDLKIQIEGLDPARFDFSAGWVSRLLGKLPGIGLPVKRYLIKFESAQTVIDAIINSLALGRNQLERDNITLAEDQKGIRELTYKLEQQIRMTQLIDNKLQYQLEREITADDPRRIFIEEELIFPLRQRVLDLQQQLAVNQQGILAIAVLINNNRELVRGVNRALDVTVNALQVAVTVAMGLAHQKIVLDKVGALNKTTSGLIASTAVSLKTQGCAIHDQASGAMLDMNALKSAFVDINQAMEEISSYRRDALPRMAATILEFDQLAAQGEKAIRQLEQGVSARPLIDITLE